MTAGIIKLCLEECEASQHQQRMGAVVFKGKRIISSGHNAVRSSSICKKHKKYENSLHAEQAAVMNLDWEKLKGCSILILRTSKKKKLLGNAKPCSMCQKLLNKIGITDIYYSNSNGEIVKLSD